MPGAAAVLHPRLGNIVMVCAQQMPCMPIFGTAAAQTSNLSTEAYLAHNLEKLCCKKGPCVVWHLLTQVCQHLVPAHAADLWGNQ